MREITGTRNLLCVLFTLSGFSGLIYESIWSHYLKLFLGHAAYAQTLVLSIFMGGMALGSWLAARYSMRWRNLLLGYAVVEGLIGLAGLGFHSAFDGGTALAYTTIIPALGSVTEVQIFKWGFSALLILPQSVLLGMTFPLMTGALVRISPDQGGLSIATLYFANSFGAAVGVLVSGFALIAWVGLPGTVMTAGLLNILLALVVWLLSREASWNLGALPPAHERTMTAERPWYALLLLTACITGAASFIYEIGWIRMLAMVLGSSTHGFELMLSAFIFGLALGSLWVRRRIDRLTEPVRLLVVVQIVMGACALLSMVIYGHTFRLMSALLAMVPRDDTGYLLFNLASHGIAFVVMLPATFCAGITLPLITHTLLRRGHGESSIGAVYAANTLGAIAGVVVAVHLLMPGLGLKGLLSVGAGLDIGLGALLLWLLVSRPRPRRVAATVVGGMVVLVATLALVELDPNQMASGVYSSGDATTPQGARITEHRDGKTATVTLLDHDVGIRVISTNGKADASMQMQADRWSTADQSTAVLAAVLPIAMRPDARRAAVIGFGSGLTSHTLLGWPGLERVDTIEIEPMMVRVAEHFRPRVERAYTDPRGVVHIEDAKTFFATAGERYDIIISEPSNAWVSGVASLFTHEFYAHTKRHLNRDGVLAQWIHVYRMNHTLLASIIKALAQEFAAYEMYTMNDGDLLLLATNGQSLELDTAAIFGSKALSAELASVYINSPDDLQVLKLGDQRILNPLFASNSVAMNSDYFPVLDLNAARSRFMEETATDMMALSTTPIPIVEMLAGYGTGRLAGTRPVYNPHVSRLRANRIAAGLSDFLVGGRADFGGYEVSEPVKARARRMVALLERCDEPDKRDEWFQHLVQIANLTLPYLQPAELEPFWQGLETSSCASHWGPLEHQWVALFRAVSRRDGETMSQIAGQLLEASEPGSSAVRTEYLLATAALGHLVQGRASDAARLWDSYGDYASGAIIGPVGLRLLRALSGVSPTPEG